jgi:hypothetical protein
MWWQSQQSGIAAFIAREGAAMDLQKFLSHQYSLARKESPERTHPT